MKKLVSLLVALSLVLCCVFGAAAEDKKHYKIGIVLMIENGAFVDMKNGVISDFEISATKLALVNYFQSSNDTVSGIESWYCSQLTGSGYLSIEEMSKMIQSVTKEQIVAAAEKLTLDTVYLLKNK